MGIRSFLAFELPPEIMERICGVSLELKNENLPVRWVKRDNIHLTLIFLGNVEEHLVENIKEQVGFAATKFIVFKAGLSGLGVFPDFSRPRVLWAGLNGDIERVSNLQSELQDRLHPLGFSFEKRPFRPHVTIGRFKKGQKFGKDEFKWLLDKYQDNMTSNLYELKELVLFKSELRREGPVYTKMQTWSLKENNHYHEGR